MADTKKYYYLKVKEDFYDSDEIKLLESLENGYLYSNILLKLYLKSIKHEGRLMFKENIPYNSKMLATVTGHNKDVVENAIKLFKEFGLIDIVDNGAIYMLDIQNFIGKSSTEGDRKREYRASIETEKNTMIGTNVRQKSDKQAPEIEIEIEIEKDIEIELELDDSILLSKASTELSVNDSIPYREIIDYLNLVANTNYKHSASDTKKYIKARWNEGFRLEQFKTVIEKKYLDWVNTEWEKFMRPSTLFSNKFESYLNAPLSKKKMTLKNLGFDYSKYFEGGIQ